jgi:hypothetical protein
MLLLHWEEVVAVQVSVIVVEGIVEIFLRVPGGVHLLHELIADSAEAILRELLWPQNVAEVVERSVGLVEGGLPTRVVDQVVE